jgi:broad specificity phosphatase PhoE
MFEAIDFVPRQHKTSGPGGPILAQEMPGTPVLIFLARHGETVFNVEGRWQGQSDSPLTARGLAQAQQLARALADEQVSAVYSSDLGRAASTAHEVARLHGLEVIADRRLREIHVGQWTGLSRAEIEVIDAEGLREWARRPLDLRMVGGETILEAQQRALAFFAESMPHHLGESVVVITHGAIAQAILVNGLGGTVADLWLKQRIDNCQISRMEWTPENGLRVIELCDVRHLAETGSLRGWRVTEGEGGAVA